MQDLGISILFKGINFWRLLGGLWVTLRISLIAVAFSIPPASGEAISILLRGT